MNTTTPAFTATEIREHIAGNPNMLAGAIDAPIRPGTRVIIHAAQGNEKSIGTQGIVVGARRLDIHPDAAATIRAMGREPLPEHYLVIPLDSFSMRAITCPLDGLEVVTTADLNMTADGDLVCDMHIAELGEKTFRDVDDMQVIPVDEAEVFAQLGEEVRGEVLCTICHELAYGTIR